MRSFVLRIIVIEHCSAGGFPLEEVSEHCFLSIKELFWCCGFIYYVVPLLFSTIFFFSAIIIDLVPYKWYHNTFLGIKLWVIFFRVETYSDILKLQRFVIQCINPVTYPLPNQNFSLFSADSEPQNIYGGLA
jgi:hypothetical protein